ncbi:hypothetical protein MA16_Dca005940 [Dendrobium catenatum]|uniref:Retrovirus-related Pol polyprotein from transposon TNT 1-94 n=1 Tax=Dendrobium catenatum TaxID=906689 RepID=A0A2I0WJR3_9ASPA|nr:hypothetical protein MA16_Dca005940 [Dendrobium catenatum]
MYTLNGLPPSYQAFKTYIRANLQPVNIDDFYALLCSEEVNLAAEAARENQALPSTDPQLALSASRGRGRFRSNRGRGRYNQTTPSPVQQAARPPGRNSNTYVECQICRKPGHSAFKCWHRANLQYQPVSSSAFVASSASETGDWVLDSGATSHLTSDFTQLQNPQNYTGAQQVQIGNGDMLPITHSGQGILPTPQRLEEQSNSSSWSLPSRPL